MAEMRPNQNTPPVIRRKCNICQGDGLHGLRECPVCHGEGVEPPPDDGLSGPHWSEDQSKYESNCTDLKRSLDLRREVLALREEWLLVQISIKQQIDALRAEVKALKEGE